VQIAVPVAEQAEQYSVKIGYYRSCLEVEMLVVGSYVEKPVVVAGAVAAAANFYYY
jgi:hypothetical protein